MIPHEKRYQHLVLYICKKLGGELHGKKKLAKLLYFIDFDSYEKTESPITHDVYRALPMGPVPDHLNELTAIMQKDGLLVVDQKNEYEGYHPTEIYHCLIEPDLSLFTTDERRMIDRVLIRYGHLSGKQLQDLSHAEAPYVATLEMQEIPYELTYYRGTDFSDL